MEGGRRNQIPLPISDLIQPIVPCTQPGDDHLVYPSVPVDRDQAPVAGVLLHYLPVTHQLHGAAGRVKVKGGDGRVAMVGGGGENGVGMGGGQKEGDV